MNITNTNLILSNYIKSLSDDTVQNVVDASGAVNFGKALSTIDFSDDMYKTDIGAGSIMDKIIKTDFYSSTASNTAPKNIYKDYTDWGTFTELIRVDAGDYYPNISYDGNGSGENGKVTFDDIFGNYDPVADAKYFNGLDTDEIRYTISEKKWNAAFKSESDFNRFVSEIHNAINVRRNMRTQIASYFTFDALIAGVCNEGTFSNGTLTANKRVVALDSTSAETIMSQIRNAIRDMAEYSGAYTSGDFVTATDKTNLTLAIDSVLFDRLKYALGDKFHTEWLELEKLGVEIDVRYKWALSNAGTNNNDIIIKTENTPAKSGVDDVIATSVSGIQWVLYHDYSAGCTRYNERVKVQPIPAEEKTNSFFKADYAYRVNIDFPCLVCVDALSGVTLVTDDDTE